MRPMPRPAQSDPARFIPFSASRRSPVSSGLLLTVVLSALALVTAACGSSNNTTTTTAPPATTTAATTDTAATTSATAPTKAAASSGLSGTWSGEYSGAYHGMFTLKWQQSGSNLNGTIKLSAPASTLSIHGTLAGSNISFGTVGSLAITYSGSVSGSSMSGTYQVNGTSGGPWSATKTG